MAKQNIQSTRVEDVLQRIEAREKSKTRRKRMFYGAMAIGLLGAGGFAFNSLTRTTENLPLYQYADLSQDQLSGILTSDVAEILVQHPDLGTETIRSMADYTRFNETVAMARRFDELSADGELDTTAQSLAPFVIDIAGVRRAGELLVFSIENHDPEIDYLLDLGNGQRRKVTNRVSYRYPLSGNFDVKLLATKGEASSIYVKSIRINAALPKDEPQNTPANNTEEVPVQIAEETNEVAIPTQVSEIQDLDPDLFAANDANPLVEPTNARVDEAFAEPEVNNDSPAGEEQAAPNQPTQNSATGGVAGPLLASEVEPSFPGGNSAMTRFIQRNYRYPRQARNNETEGTVVVRFVVNEDGSHGNYTVLRKVGEGCDEEAIRIISRMPKWNPGTQGGQAVSVYKTLPITFKLVN
ncbi:MAG: TonB family protein [Bacteroidota bacterium]